MRSPAGATFALSSSLLVVTAQAAPPDAAADVTTPPGPSARVEITDALTVLYAADNRDFEQNSVPKLVNDDWGVLYQRVHGAIDHADFRFGFRVDHAWFYASPDPTGVALELVRRRRTDPAGIPDPAYFRAKVDEAGRELSNRYINWVYPTKYFTAWQSRELELTLGDAYAELGQGLVLSLRKRDEIASDDSLRGARATSRLRLGDARLALTALGGAANPLRIDEASGRYLGVHPSVTPGWLAVTEAGMPRAIETDFAPDTGDCRTTLTCSYAPDRIFAGQLAIEIEKTRLGTQGSLLLRQQALSQDVVRSARRIVTGSQSLETASADGTLAVYAEAALQKLEHRARPAAARPELDLGHAVYASATFLQAPVAVLVEAKHYRRFFPLYANVSVARAREFSLTAWSAPPTGEAAFIDTEYEGFNTCVTGGRLRADAEALRGLSAFGWFGYWETFAESVVNESCETEAANKNRVYDLASGVELASRDRSSRGILTLGARFDDTHAELTTPEGATHVFYREVYARYSVVRTLGGPYALELSGAHRRRRRTLGGPGMPWFEGEHVTALDVGTQWSVGAGFEYDTDPRTPDTYLNLVARFRPTPDASIAAFVGQRRGSLRCVGGVCREVPPFEGARLDGSVRF